MPKGGGVVGGSRSAEEIEAEIKERVAARMLAAKNLVCGFNGVAHPS
jgi:hypothetical protein